MLTFFETDQPKADTPFLSELLKGEGSERLEGKVFPINQITAASSGKGYTVYTDEFICFIWKKLKTTEQLLQALNFYYEAGNGYLLCVAVSSKFKNGFKIGVDFEQTAYWQKKDESFVNTTSQRDSELEQDTSNPYLPPQFPHSQGHSLALADKQPTPVKSITQSGQNGSRTSRKTSQV